MRSFVASVRRSLVAPLDPEYRRPLDVLVVLATRREAELTVVLEREGEEPLVFVEVRDSELEPRR